MVDSNLKIELFARVDDNLLETERVDAFGCELQEAFDLNSRVDLRNLLEQTRHRDLLDRLDVLGVVFGLRVRTRLEIVETLVDAFAQLQRVELDLETFVEVANLREHVLHNVVLGQIFKQGETSGRLL